MSDHSDESPYQEIFDAWALVRDCEATIHSMRKLIQAQQSQLWTMFNTIQAMQKSIEQFLETDIKWAQNATATMNAQLIQRARELSESMTPEEYDEAARRFRERMKESPEYGIFLKRESEP